MPKISIINESGMISDGDIQKMLPAFDQQWNADLRTAWGVDQAEFAFFPAGQEPAAGSWWIVFLDNSDQADALAYHDLTNEGLPISKVFVGSILADKADIGVGATHEICEMAVDPWLNSAYQDANGTFWAGEICDPVEDDQYGYKIGDTLVTDFVLPSWFAHKFSKGACDLKGHALNAFEVLTAGYAQKFDSQAGWVQVTGSKALSSARASAPKGSRRERRARKVQGWRHSDVVWSGREAGSHPLFRASSAQSAAAVAAAGKPPATVPSSGRIMVRVARTKFQAMMAATPADAATAARTRPLFGASHAARLQFGTHLAPEQQQDWLLHQPDHSDMNPWDVAHQLVQGSLPGAEQFAGDTPVYAEPDLLNTRQVPAPAPAAMRGAMAAAAPGAATAASEGLNTHYPPTPPPDFSPAWHLEPGFANFIAAWQTSKGEGVRIAHLDTGYTPGHMSLPRHLLADQGYNFSGDNTNTVDPYLSGIADQPGHGTATLALLAGGTVNIGFGTQTYRGDIGGAPEASVIPVRIGPSVIHIYSADLAQGLDYALAPRGGTMCDVVSLSHGGLPSNAWAEAVNRLYEAGVVVVAAAGDSFYLEIMDVATHFTVYPAAFYRVVTATGATYTHDPYVTSDFGTMQGCWGPDKVMKKAVAAYTPNVPWMSYKGSDAWDMDGGGTSASTPQVAAACALWLKQYGQRFPVGWQRVEACRHALFASVAARNANLSKIGAGTLDADAMLSVATIEQVQAAYTAGALPHVAPDQVSFPFWRLLFGLPPAGPGVDEMYETEAAQIFYRSNDVALADAVAANPDGDPNIGLPANAAQLRAQFIAEQSMSNALREHLSAQPAPVP